MTQAKSPTPAEVKAARVAAGLAQQACADRFGYKIRGWQQKEESGPSGRALSPGEYELLLLLGGQHPEFTLQKRRDPSSLSEPGDSNAKLN